MQRSKNNAKLSCFILIVIVLLCEVHSLTCELTAYPKRAYNNVSMKPTFRFSSDQKCKATRTNLIYQFKGQSCTLIGTRGFYCFNTTAWNFTQDCNNSFVGSNQVKNISISGTITFAETNETCIVSGSTTLQWIAEPQPQPLPPDEYHLYWWVYVLIVLGALAIGAIAFLLIRKFYCKKSITGNDYSQVTG